MGTSANVTRGVLNHVLRGVPYTAPQNLFLGLHTGDPGATGPEVDGTYYSRHPVTFTDHGGNMQSNEIMEFPSLNAGPPITHWGIYDHPTRGNLLFWDRFTEPAPRRGGETLRLDPNAVTIT